jgi:hypothetical protein
MIPIFFPFLFWLGIGIKKGGIDNSEERGENKGWQGWCGISSNYLQEEGVIWRDLFR